MAKVSLKNVSNSSSESGRVNDVSLEIEDRAFAVITGPACCGKTTLLRMIAGLDEVSNGDILIGDRRVNDLKPNERDVAMVFSDDALYPDMSVRQNVAFGLKLRKFSQTEIARRVEDATIVLGVERLLDRRPPDLSKAERQRVSIARAIARQPKVLLCDEPLANLDAGMRAQLRAELIKLHERLQTTVIYATGEASDAIALGQRVIVLRDGALQQNDLAQTVYDAPANVFAGGFIGAPPMNFIQGTLKMERESWLFSEVGEGTIQLRMALSEHPELAGNAGKPMLLGIRPEHVEILDIPKGQETGASTFPAVIDFVERLGAETIFHLQTGAHTIVCRASSRSRQEMPVGRRVRFRYDLAKVHFFDPASTFRIVAP